MSWALLEKMLAEASTHSTLIGKYWFSFLYVFRVVTVLSVGDKVYGDEQSAFKCNTLQPGCDNVCFNKFSPISHIRFWAMQILLVALPTVIFIIWAMHSLNKAQLKKEKWEKEKKEAEVATEPIAEIHPVKTKDKFGDKPPKYNGETEKKSVSDKNSRRRSSRPRHSTRTAIPMAEIVPVNTVTPPKFKDPPILTGYVLQVIFRLAIEIVFIILQYILFKTWVPEMIKCTRYPCPGIVECFVSRPMEKTIFLYYMYGIALCSVVLDVIELNYLGVQKIIHCFTGDKKGYLQEFEDRWQNDEVLRGRFDIIGRGRGLRRHRDMSITDADSNDAYNSRETSDDGSGFE